MIKSAGEGTPNKFTATLKEDALGAADDVGMIVLKGKRWQATGKGGRRAYLRWAAVHQPASFIGLLARFIPAELNVKTDTKVSVNYGTIEEKRAALIERGIDPDAIERSMTPKFLLEHHKETTE